MKNKELWNKIEQYPLIDYEKEANIYEKLLLEYQWPIHFVDKLILEYKKFIYLCCLGEGMVAPSPLVDIVWHEHLTDRRAYEEFCYAIIGRKIHHKPNTRAPHVIEKQKESNNRTMYLYKKHFGEMPMDIWENKKVEKLKPLKSLFNWAIFYYSFLFLGLLYATIIFLPMLFELSFIENLLVDYRLWVVCLLITLYFFQFTILFGIQLRTKKKLKENGFFKDFHIYHKLSLREQGRKHVLAYLLYKLYKAGIVNTNKGRVFWSNAHYTVDIWEASVKKVLKDNKFKYVTISGELMKTELFRYLRQYQVRQSAKFNRSFTIVMINSVFIILHAVVLGGAIAYNHLFHDKSLAWNLFGHYASYLMPLHDAGFFIIISSLIALVFYRLYFLNPVYNHFLFGKKVPLDVPELIQDQEMFRDPDLFIVNNLGPATSYYAKMFRDQHKGI